MWVYQCLRKNIRNIIFEDSGNEFNEIMVKTGNLLKLSPVWEALITKFEFVITRKHKVR